MVTGGANAGRVGLMISRYCVIKKTDKVFNQHFLGRSIPGLLTYATSRTAMGMSLPPGSTMSSPLAR